MLGELDEKQSYKTISYCPEVENLDGKQTTQKKPKKQTNKQTNKKTQKNPHNPISQSTSYLNSVRLITSIIQHPYSENLTPMKHFETFAIPQGTPFPKLQKL